jgi:sensor c-di-GMP phosphodiesterase-like protein
MIAYIVLAALCLGIAAGCAVVVLWARAERRDERNDEGAERALHAGDKKVL